jgi:hypothetical protein
MEDSKPLKAAKAVFRGFFGKAQGSGGVFPLLILI